jgi:hypothetical protein
MVPVVSQKIGGNPMGNKNTIKDLIGSKFDKKKVETIVNYFLDATQKFEEGDWEGILVKSGKFVEAVVKLIWTYAGKTLPKPKEFKVAQYAKKIIDEAGSTIPSDGVRLQIPRACIFLYDITSNRGGRHDSDEFDPNEMDAVTALPLCSWILAELVCFCAPSKISPDDAKKMVESIVERRYPIFEEIDGRIYVEKHKSAIQCALMILYKRFPNRMSKEELFDAVIRHRYKKTALKFERLLDYIDIDTNDNILLRGSGRKKVEKLSQRK